MSNYFNKFPKILYLFGDEITPVAFQNLSKYIPLIDEIADEIAAYTEYEITDFERPDTLSYRLYGKSTYDWTFYLMNDRLREVGWPLSQQDAYTRATTKTFRDWVFTFDITTADSSAYIAQNFPIKDEIISLGGRDMIVKRKNLQTGELYLRSPNASFNYDSDFSNINIIYTEDEEGATVQWAGTSKPEYLGIHSYVDSDGDPQDYFFWNGPLLTPKTNLEWFLEENAKTKRIRVIRKDLIDNVSGKFRALLSN